MGNVELWEMSIMMGNLYVNATYNFSDLSIHAGQLVKMLKIGRVGHFVLS